MFKYTEQADHPVPCVNAVITNEHGQFLLVNRLKEPFKGGWGMVGGRIEAYDDNAEEAIKREVKEETGLDIEVLNLVDILAKGQNKEPADPRFYIVQVVYEVKVVGGELTINDEASDFRWVDIVQAQKEKLIFNHNEIFSTYFAKKEAGRLIPAQRSVYGENFGKNYDYTLQNLFPRFAVNGIILNEKNEILLARRSQAPFIGHWDFPGGHMKMEESVADCLKREIWEELGVGSEMGELFHVYSDKGKHTKFADVVSYYFTKIDSQNFQKNVEMNEFGYFSFQNLPKEIAYHNEWPLKDIADFLGKKK